MLRFERRSPARYSTGVPQREMAFVGDYARTLSAVLAVAAERLALDGSGRPVKAHFVTGNFFSETGAAARIDPLHALRID